MGLFGTKNTQYAIPRKKPIELNMTNLLILVIMSLVMIQAFGLIFGNALGINIKLGPAFILISVGMASAMSIALFKKLLDNSQITKKDVFAVVITALLALVIMFFLKSFVPEIFEQSLLQLQSLIGIN